MRVSDRARKLWGWMNNPDSLPNWVIWLIMLLYLATALVSGIYSMSRKGI